MALTFQQLYFDKANAKQATTTKKHVAPIDKNMYIHIPKVLNLFIVMWCYSCNGKQVA